jgi:hypothetical protein
MLLFYPNAEDLSTALEGGTVKRTPMGVRSYQISLLNIETLLQHLCRNDIEDSAIN